MCVMFDCNDQVTVWNRWRDPDDQNRESFVRHVIPVLCKWKNNKRGGVAGKGAATGSNVLVIIPDSEKYRDEKTWAAMTEAERAEYFTLQTGDPIALGAQSVEITGEKPYRVADIKKLLELDIAQITDHQDNTRSAMGKHHKVEGV